MSKRGFLVLAIVEFQTSASASKATHPAVGRRSGSAPPAIRSNPTETRQAQPYCGPESRRLYKLRTLLGCAQIARHDGRRRMHPDLKKLAPSKHVTALTIPIA